MTKTPKTVDLAQLQTAADRTRAAEADAAARAAAADRAYLGQTDWYVIRQMETGDPVPADVASERGAARARLSALPQAAARSRSR